MEEKETDEAVPGNEDDEAVPGIEEPRTRPSNCLRGATIRLLENGFDSYGQFVARCPAIVIFVCVLLTCLCGGGLYWFRMENEGIKLWIPYNSDFRLNNDWLFEEFPRDTRFNSMIFTAENVLTADNLRAIYRISKSIRSTKSVNNDTWTDHCYKRPVIKAPSLLDFFGRKRRRKRQDDDFFDDFFEEMDASETEDVDESGVNFNTTNSMELATKFSVTGYPDPYCGIIANMPKACMELSILEMFGKDGEYGDYTDQLMESLSDDQALAVINSANVSGIFLTPFNFTSFLSGVRRDARGWIVGAEATIMFWFGQMNMTEAKVNPAPGRGEPIDPRMLAWEGSMLNIMLNKTGYPDGLDSYPNVARSFGDIASSTILGDVSVLVIGYGLMFQYATVMLGKISCIQHRTLLATVGILGVMMGIIVSYGVCSAAGVFYGPMHSVLPFLILGIGIDDMFVIVQCWDTLPEAKRLGSLESRFGSMMRQAGAAITVTSATDIIAFGVGGFTILPALKSFCIYAAVGIVATFIFQASFFVAWMSIDQRRIEANRNGCCPCYVHPEATTVDAPSMSLMQKAFKTFAELLMNPRVKLVIAAVTLLLTGVGILGNVRLRQEFDPAWFLPPDTYIAKWFVNNKLYFPASGERGTVYFSNTSLPASLPAINLLAERLANQSDIVTDVDTWTRPYMRYITMLGHDGDAENINGTFFRKSLSQFLFSPAGAQYLNGFKFDGKLECGLPAPEVLLSEITYTHRLFAGPSEHVPAMNRVKQLIHSANIPGRVFAMALGYATWETDEIISLEIYRNMALGILCVFITTLIFVSSFSGAALILACVCLTLTDVGGFMHFWGLTIDTVSCNNLIIAIGLCVDYSAHIMHSFLTEEGSREARVVKTLVNIGPAVLNGGCSTFLAFILLATSKSHVFLSFFKIFFLVVTFGLFHGLVVLPVILSWVGPKPVHYAALQTKDSGEDSRSGNETETKV